MELLLLALQAVAGPVLAEARPRLAERTCPPAREGEVTVCGRREEPFRLKRLPARYDESALPKAETTVLGNARLGVETDQGSVGGVSSNRAMVRLKVPF
ncbi:hypothetical protein [Sphingomonas lycopersici]|uniref:Uncharacterized protein n=1 Tax=Sphingomonas lycopersici TaxID=2951807 RepID=A0AA41Z7K9_9SPHN|nr:hypothetical protein [Sphingomonas lycopersici]MCW6534312.1 hypothetical protein [Sphingomonas lycopersici]